MQKTFHLHRQAVFLEQQLQFVQDKGMDPTKIDITNIYTQPVLCVEEFVKQLHQDHKGNARIQWFTKMIALRYQRYADCVFSQLDEDIRYALCKDLETLTAML